MRRLSINLSAAAIAFAIGFAISCLVRLSVVEESIQPIASTDLTLIRPQIQELPDLPREPNSAQASGLAIDIDVGGSKPNSLTYELRYIKLAKRGTTLIHLDLGEYIDNSEVILIFRDSSATYRIFQRYRTSMTISGEGPHLDLIDWRHFDSPWTLLKSLGPNRFRTVPEEQMPESTFPKTSKADIVKEVRRRVGNDWPRMLELAQRCKGPNDGACIVLTSSIYLRIQKQFRGRWTEAGLVEFQVPMGC